MSRSPRQLKPASPDPSAAGRIDQSAFTLVELMVACAVMAVMLVLISVAIGQVSNGMKSSTAKVDAFQSARTGFETVTRALSVATLNPYWDYYNSDNLSRSHSNGITNFAGTNYVKFVPAKYGRQSDLHFFITNMIVDANNSFLPAWSNAVTHGVFFQAPLGYNTNGTTNPPGSLNACGFFVAFGPDPTIPNITGLTNNRGRFRLHQWLQSSESLQERGDIGVIDAATDNVNIKPPWINVSSNNGIRPLAENIIAFVVRVPDTSSGIATNATSYFWNSQIDWPPTNTTQPPQMHQLPPLVEVTMVAVDEAAVNRRIRTATNTYDVAIRNLTGINQADWLTLFINPANYSTDLKRVTDGLNARRIPYRVFTTTIPLRSSRWSP